MPPPSRLPTHQLNTITSHTGPVNALAFSNLGGTYLLSGSSDRQIHLSRTEPTTTSTTSTPIQKYTSHGYPILSLSISPPNTHFLSSSSGDRSIFYWDIQTPTSTLRRLGGNTSGQHTARVTCVCFAGESGDAVCVSGSDDRSVRVWDLRSRDNRPVMVLEGARDGVSCLVVPGNLAGGGTGAEIMAGSVDGRVRSYDVRTGRVTVDVQPGAVTDMSLTRDGRCLLVGCLDGRIRVMDRSDGSCLRTLPEASASSDSSSKGGVDIGGYRNTSIRLQSCFGGGHEDLVVSGSEADSVVRAWDVLSGKQVDEVVVSPVGKVVSVVRWRDGGPGKKPVWAAGGADGVVRVYGAKS